MKRRLVCDHSFHTLREDYVALTSTDTASAVRHDDFVTIIGYIDENQKKESVKIDALPWYGSVFLLKGFARSDKEKMKFYVSKPEEFKMVKLKAIREGVETIEVDGESMEAVKIRYTVPDMRRLYWSSYYWYRASDGVLVKTEETRGPPGTPKTRVELTDEKRFQGAAPAKGLSEFPFNPPFDAERKQTDI